MIHKMKELFQKNMFWLIFGITIGIYLNLEINSTWNLNRTIGWGWEPYLNFSIFLPSFYTSLIIFNIGYGILMHRKQETNLKLSILHLLLIFFTFMLSGFYSVVELILNLCSMIIFLLNMASSKP